MRWIGLGSSTRSVTRRPGWASWSKVRAYLFPARRCSLRRPHGPRPATTRSRWSSSSAFSGPRPERILVTCSATAVAGHLSNVSAASSTSGPPIWRAPSFSSRDTATERSLSRGLSSACAPGRPCSPAWRGCPSGVSSCSARSAGWPGRPRLGSPATCWAATSRCWRRSSAPSASAGWSSWSSLCWLCCSLRNAQPAGDEAHPAPQEQHPEPAEHLGGADVVGERGSQQHGERRHAIDGHVEQSEDTTPDRVAGRFHQVGDGRDQDGSKLDPQQEAEGRAGDAVVHLEVGKMLHRLRHRRERQERHPVRDEGTLQNARAVDVAEELSEQDRAQDRAGGGRAEDDVCVLRCDADDLAHVGGCERVEVEKDKNRDAHLAELETQAA